MADFPTEIIKRRDARGLTQEQLAVAADVSRSTVQNAERGQTISRKAAAKIAKALGWSGDTAATLARKGVPTIVLQGEIALRLRDAASAAGKPVDAYLAAMLPKPSKAKR